MMLVLLIVAGVLLVAGFVVSLMFFIFFLVTLSWQKVPLLTVGDSPLATMTVPVAVFQLMRRKLPAALVGAW